MNPIALSRAATLTTKRRAGDQLACAWLLLAAVWYALTALATIANFAWPQLIFDQLRSYTFYLGLPFPANVLAMENGHRPIVPALLRVAEIHLFAANQYLQIGFGTLCATLTAGLIAHVVWREEDLPTPLRAAGVLMASVAIFWLANARMLLHGTESEHAYLVMLCLLVGSLMVRRCAHEGGFGWMVGAATACVIATFTFGAGIALLPTFLLIGWLLRTPWRYLWVLVGTTLACFVLYVFVLPGDGAVRNYLELRPLDSLIVAVRWLASPWITGWLGLADPPVTKMVLRTPLAEALKSSANFLQTLLHLEWRSSGAALIGMAGLGVAAIAVVAKAVHRGPMTRVQTLALTIVVFGAATAAIIGIGRIDYLERHPDQIFADRYLLWPCLFWLGIWLALVTASTGRPWLRRGLLALATVLPVMLYTLHVFGAGWGATVYRNDQASAAAGMSDLFDERLFRNDAAATVKQSVQVYRLMRERRLGPFRIVGSDRLHETLAVAPSPPVAGISVDMGSTSAVADARDRAAGVRFQGVVSTGIRVIHERGPLAVIDPDRRIVGYAMFSHVGKPMRTLSLSLPLKRGFDGYIKGYDPAIRYRLVSMASAGDESWELADIPSPQS